MPASTPRLRRRIASRTPGVRGLVARYDALEQERDRLARKVRRLEDPMRSIGVRPGIRYLFVMTYGRSGSTLLQGVLNSIDGYCIRGENHAAMHRLFAMHRILVAEKEKRATANTRPRNPWFGIEGYPVDVAYEEFRRFALRTILRPRRATRVVGYKEVRWDRPHLEEYLEFLDHVFPDARYVINTRDHDGVLKSGWWPDAPDAARKLNEFEGSLLRAGERLGDRAFRVHYDDYVADPDCLQELFTWLGASWSRERVDRVMGERHSY